MVLTMMMQCRAGANIWKWIFCHFVEGNFEGAEQPIKMDNKTVRSKYSLNREIILIISCVIWKLIDDCHIHTFTSSLLEVAKIQYIYQPNYTTLII